MAHACARWDSLARGVYEKRVRNRETHARHGSWQRVLNNEDIVGLEGESQTQVGADSSLRGTRCYRTGSGWLIHLSVMGAGIVHGERRSPPFCVKGQELGAVNGAWRSYTYDEHEARRRTSASPLHVAPRPKRYTHLSLERDVLCAHAPSSSPS